MKTSLRRNLLFVVALAVFGLSACSSGATATPTESLDAVYTSAAQTLTAQAAQTTPTPALTATAKSTLTPFVTVTDTPHSLPTLGGASATPQPQNVCDNAAYISDVTIPDHSVLVPGEGFVKTWELQNTGTCTWTPTYAINYVSGDQMSGAATAIGQSVAPGQKANISITLVAPATPGEYTGYWRLNNDKGKIRRSRLRPHQSLGGRHEHRDSYPCGDLRFHIHANAEDLRAHGHADDLRARSHAHSHRCAAIPYGHDDRHANQRPADSHANGDDLRDARK